MRGALILILSCWLLDGASARAQERRPLPIDVVLSPVDGEPVAVRARDWGLVVRHADDRWRLWCPGALGATSSSKLYLAALGPDTLMIGNYSGLSRVDIAACSRTRIAEFEDFGVRNLERGEDAVLRAIVTAGGDTSVITSEDAAETWTMSPVGDTAGFLDGLFAPSDPTRVYLFAVRTDIDSGTSESFLAVSTDGGATLTEHPLPPEDPNLVFQLLAVDPSNPDRLYAAMAQPDRGGHSHPSDDGGTGHILDRVYVSDDAGQSWTELIEVGLLGGFAMTRDGQTLWVGDTDGGLHRSTDGGSSFERLHPDTGVSCLRHDRDRLWVCADLMNDGFSLAVSDDAGDNLETYMRFDEVVGPADCNADRASACARSWQQWLFWLGLTDTTPDAGAGLDAGLDAGPAATDVGDVGDVGNVGDGGGDGGRSPKVSADEDGCGCRAPGAATTPRRGLLLPLLALVCLRRWRRRRRS